VLNTQFLKKRNNYRKKKQRNGKKQRKGREVDVKKGERDRLICKERKKQRDKEH
jgi:hypothetical protein